MSQDNSSKSQNDTHTDAGLDDAGLESAVSVWQCVLCDHLESQSSVRCSQCNYWRVDVWGADAVDTNAVSSRDSNMQGETESGDEERDADQQARSRERRGDRVLTHAFAKLQKLFVRAQREGRKLGDGERAEVYEALLQSLLKIERAEIKRATIKRAFEREREELEQEREELRRAHMIHLSLIWFLGICVGFALYAGLEYVSRL